MNAKRFTIMIAFVLLVVILTACGSKTVTQVVEKVVRETQLVSRKETSVVKVVETQEVSSAQDYSQPAATAAPLAQAGAAGETALLSYNTQSSVRMVIKDVEMELLVQDTDLAIDRVTQLTADYGGYILSSQTWYDGNFKYASIRVTVPSVAFENALVNLRHIGLQVVSEAGSGQDVSAEYTDLQTRLTNLEATAARVREFLKAAQTVEESLKVSAQLSELEGQIEQIKGQMRFYEGRSAFSTITVNLTPQHPTPTPTTTPTPTPTPTPTSTPTPEPQWNPGNTLDDASSVLANVAKALVDMLIWLVVVFGPFVLIGFLTLWVILRLMKVRK